MSPERGRKYPYSDSDFRQVQKIAFRKAGITIPDTRRQLVYSRLSRRLREVGKSSFEEYLNWVILPGSAHEMTRMICSLTTNVTGFFRERHHFDHMRMHILPKIKEAARRGDRVRLWSSACSSGEEPWSMAMTILETFPDAPLFDVKILATDINTDVLERGQVGIYSKEESFSIPTSLKSTFMELMPDKQYFRFRGDIRELVSFRQLNLNGDWPMRGDFQVIFCRNVAIYFNNEIRNRLWARLAQKIQRGGALYIGHSERILDAEMLHLRHWGPTSYRKES